MKKKLFSLFSFAMIAIIFCGCSDKNKVDSDDIPTIVERENDYDDGITYNGSIAILSDSPSDPEIDTAAALRFLGGVTSEVTDETVAAIVEGNPTKFVYDINELLYRGGVVFFYEPKEAQMIEWLNHEDNIFEASPEYFKIFNLDKLELFGLTKDGAVYSYEKSEGDIDANEMVEEGEGSDCDIQILDKGHDDIYDSSEYLMLAGIIGFLEEEESNKHVTRAEGSKLDPGTPYFKDFEIHIKHGTANKEHKEDTLDLDKDNIEAKALFSAHFNIVHSFDFNGKGDYYFVKAVFQAHCNTFCKAPWQNYTERRRHSLQGDVLKKVTFEVEPIVGSKEFSVVMAKNAEPTSVPKEKKIDHTTTFGLEGNLNLGASSAPDGGKEGGLELSPSFNWEASETIITKEWDIVNTNRTNTTIGYSIITGDDLNAKVKNGDSAAGASDVIEVPNNARSTINAAGFWVWQVPETQKNTTVKGIEKLRITLRDLQTRWICDRQWGKSYQGNVNFDPVTLDLALQLTKREEFGEVKITNTLDNAITNIAVYNANGKKVFNSNVIAIENGSTYTMCLPTREKYNIRLINAKGTAYELIKAGGDLLMVSQTKPVELKSGINFQELLTEATIVIENTNNKRIIYVTVTDITDPANPVTVINTKLKAVQAGQELQVLVQPNRKYTASYRIGMKDIYEFRAPDGEDQFIMIDKAGDKLTLDAVENFELKQ